MYVGDMFVVTLCRPDYPDDHRHGGGDHYGDRPHQYRSVWGTGWDDGVGRRTGHQSGWMELSGLDTVC